MDVAHYFDSSALLEMLFQQEHASEVLECWENSPSRVSSLLSYFECVNVSQRLCSKLAESSKLSWQRDALKWLDRAMSSMALHEVNTTVLTRLKQETRLGQCRTLDAIHLSTALLMRDVGVEIFLVTYDDRMKKSARELGLKLYQKV